AVDGAEVAVLVGPLVPDAHPALLQPAHIGVPAQEPQQLEDDRAGVHPLGGDQREPLRQVEADLLAEEAAGAGAGAVALGVPGLHDLAQQVLVGGGDRHQEPFRSGRAGVLPRTTREYGVSTTRGGPSYPWMRSARRSSAVLARTFLSGEMVVNGGEE